MSAATLRAMMDAGLKGPRLLAVVEAMEADIAAALPKRSKGAERQQRYRDKQASQRDVTSDVTHSVTEERNDGDAPLSLETKAPTPPKTLTLSSKENPPKGGQKKRGSRIPDDFVPSLDAATAEGLSRRQAEREASKFVDYWRGVAGANGVKLDWPATWRNWCRRAAENFGVESKAQGSGTMVKNSDPRWALLKARWEKENQRTLSDTLVTQWLFPEAWLIDANEFEKSEAAWLAQSRTRAA